MKRVRRAGATDEAAIRKLMADYTEASNRHDATGMAVFWAEDGDSISATGQVTRGRANIEKAVAELHSTFFKGVHITRTVETIRFLRADVAVADGTLVTTGALAHDGKELPPLRSLYTIVTMKQKGRWWIVAARSMMPIPPLH